METKTYNSKLRALLSIRNFNKALEDHYEQMKQIEKKLDGLNKNAISIIETHCREKEKEKWMEENKAVTDSISEINDVLKLLHEKLTKKEKTDSSVLWETLDLNENKLKKRYKESQSLGFEILPSEVHKHWQKDICNLEEAIIKLIISHTEACRLELQMIEKYTPKELDTITRIIANHVPEEFTFEEADKYEKDYLKAVEEVKKEFSSKKNLWDRFLDILAGGKHQSPSQRVMMQRWLEGEKEDSL